MRTLFVIYLMLILACPPAEASEVLRVSGPPIVESIPLLVLSQNKRPWEQDFEVQFIPWHSPDMLRAMVAGEQVDAAIVTTAAASTLRKKGINCRVALLHESPVWIISTRQGADSLESLEGTLLFPFGPGEMPELFYRAAMAGKHSKVTTRHTGGALEAVNLLLAGKGDHAMLSDPTASIAILRSKTLQDEGVPVLVKRVDMRTAWERSFPGHHLAASCIAFFGNKADDTATMSAFNKAYIHACSWVREHPDKAFELIQREFPSLAAQIEHGALKDLNVHTLRGEKAQADALFFLATIYKLSPAAVGGTMPGIDLFEIEK